jgi:hypothetical protein
MRRIASLSAVLVTALGLTACSEMLAAGAGAGAGYIVGSEVEEAEHDD